MLDASETQLGGLPSRSSACSSSDRAAGADVAIGESLSAIHSLISVGRSFLALSRSSRARSDCNLAR